MFQWLFQLVYVPSQGQFGLCASYLEKLGLGTVVFLSILQQGFMLLFNERLSPFYDLSS